MKKLLWSNEEHSSKDWAALFGDLNAHAKAIENTFAVKMKLTENGLQLSGEEYEMEAAEAVMGQMFTVIARQGYISSEEVAYLLQMQKEHEDVPVEKLLTDIITTTAQGKPIRAKTLGQKQYVDAIAHNGFTFGIGPAGTGKTYLAVAMAVKAFKNNAVQRIILTRPAVEAGESLGFLPGDLQEKIDPYLRPLYDSLYEILGADAYLKLKERGQIEVAPLAYMRGRTLDNSFIILDEAQNTTSAQMKMFLTRMGYGSQAVITGDVTQVDLPQGKTSGLKTIQRILRHVDGVAFCTFHHADVVRHPLVQRVIEAFERYENEQENRKSQAAFESGSFGKNRKAMSAKMSDTKRRNHESARG